MKALELQLEELEQTRIKWIVINLIGFFLWDATRITQNYLIDADLYPILKVIYGLGWLVWIVSFIQLARFGIRVKKTKLAAEILNDELIEFNRMKAWRFGFLAVLASQVVIITLSVFSIEITGMLAAELSIFIAVISAMSSFLYFNKASNE